MFNLSGSEIVFLLIIALVVLGPEKLPDAVRQFGKFYGEFKRVTSGFQSELRNALDEPMREMRETSDALRKAASLDFEPTRVDGDTGEPATEPPAPDADEVPKVEPPAPAPVIEPSAPEPVIEPTDVPAPVIEAADEPPQHADDGEGADTA